MRESVFQKIWKREAEVSPGYVTLCSRRFTVISAGEHNPGDGPDFRNAKLLFEDGTLLAGDVELHLTEDEWYTHNHHTDMAYNAVLLHVFLTPGSKPATSPDLSRPLRLDYSPYLSATTVKKTHEGAELPCSRVLHYINESVISRQLEKARRDYFSARINQLMPFWETNSTIQLSFNKMLFTALAEGLGIEANRRPMKILAQALFHEIIHFEDPDSIETLLIEKSGISQQGGVLSRQEWDLSGSRPGNKPKDRIHQLSIIGYNLRHIKKSDLLSRPDVCWQRLVAGTGSASRMGLLMHIVWFPALYILGSVVQSERLCTHAYSSWEERPAQVPPFVLEEFKQAGFPRGVLEPHLGLVHQLKRYCRVNECSKCEIGKKMGIA